MIGIDRPKFRELHPSEINIDELEAEGYEPEILNGLDIFTENIEYISADLGFERGIDQTSTFPQAKNILLKRNFEIISINNQRKVVLFKNLKFKY